MITAAALTFPALAASVTRASGQRDPTPDGAAVTCGYAAKVTIYSCRNSALGRAYAAEYGPDIDPHAVWRMAEFVREDISRAEGELLAKRMNSIVRRNLRGHHALPVACRAEIPVRRHDHALSVHRPTSRETRGSLPQRRIGES